MGTLEEKKAYLLVTKDEIRDAIIDSGYDVPEGTPFREYANKLKGINIVIEDMSYFFRNRARLSEFDKINERLLPYAKKLNYLFAGCEFHEGAATLEKTINTANCEDMSHMFHGASYTGGFGLDAFRDAPTMDTSKVKDMSYMFYGCQALKNVPAYDTSNVENMAYMFYGCEYYLTHPPTFNSQKVKDMSYMFWNCVELEDVEIDMISCENAVQIFYKCGSLENANLLNASKVGDWSNAFYGCSKLTSVTPIDMTPCINAKQMFKGCSKLSSVILSNTGLVQDMTSMFFGCKALLNIVLDTSSATTMTSMFEECSKIETIELDMSSCTEAEKLFYLCAALTSVTLKNTGNVVNMNSMFSQCNVLPNPPVLDMTSCTKASYLYNKCYAMTELNGLSAPVCKSISYICRDCTGLVKVDGFSVPVATDITYAFQGCSALEELLNVDISGATKTNYFVRDNAKLKRLTFAPMATKVPSISLLNCGLDRAGMVEMFNSLPAGASSTITITGNPCVKDGTLTAEDKALATSKGYKLTT